MAPYPADAYDYKSRETLADPWPAYAEWREQCPVAHTNTSGGYWLLTRYDDITTAARDTATFSSAGGVTIPPMQTPAPLVPFQVDPPRHVKLRALLTRHFTSRALATFPTVADEVCDRLAAPLRDQRRVELMRSYVLPVACLLFAEHIGVPRDEQEQTVEWLAPWVTPPYDGARLGEGLLAYDALLADVAVTGRAASGSFLAEVEASAIDGVPLSDDERHGLRFTLLLAGIETTLFALGNALLLLDAEPDVRAVVQDDPALISPFVEEALRLVGPAEGHARTLTCDVELHGQTIKAGEQVLLVWPSGSRDPRRFPAGDTVDLPGSSPNHLAFGFGPHKCLGAPLARIEMIAALQALLRHAPQLRVDRAAAIDWYPFSRGPMTLPVLVDG